MCLICLSDSPADRGIPPKLRAAPSEATRDTVHGLSETEMEAGRDLLRRYPSVDIHTHPGRFFMPPSQERSPFMARYAEPSPYKAVSDMVTGAISAALFATVADIAVLDRGPNGLGPNREFRPGEAIDDHRRQLASLRKLENEARLAPARQVADIVAAHASGELACIKSVEGGDFVEDRLDRLSEAHAEGIRAITLLHYRNNPIGDAQTTPEMHGGLSPLGREAIQEMDRLGIIVDLAHAAFTTTRDAAEVSTRPMMVSHSNIAPGHSHPRLITLEHARLVTAGGGIIGAVPAGFGGQHTFTDYIDTLIRMIDLLGVDHVAIGTDMDFTFRPVFTSYRDWPAIPAALLARGLHTEEVAKLLGGNFLRVLAATSAHQHRSLHA